MIRFLPSLFVMCLLVLMAGCEKEDPDPLPIATIGYVSKLRTNLDDTYIFTVSLDKPAKATITIDFTTADATALANTDYLPVSGTLTIPVNETSADIEVQVKGGDTRKEDQEFYVKLSNEKNCTLAYDATTGKIINSDGLNFPVDDTGYDAPTAYPNMTLVWSDEFDGNSINNSNWTFETGNNNGWGNSELENYTSRTKNAFVSNGHLIIEARQENFGGFGYTSARMITKDKRFFKYGRVDIRAKTPTTKGIWPALWMLGNNIGQVGWPACGEIDIMEQLGQESSRTFGTVHWGDNPAGHRSKGGNVVLSAGYDKEFHVYSIIWTDSYIRFLVDNTQFFEVINSDITGNNPFTKEHFFILNVAVGGNWPGNPDSSTKFPQRMIVDYVRMYQ